MSLEDGALNLNLADIQIEDANYVPSQRTRRETERHKNNCGASDSDDEGEHNNEIIQVPNLEEAHEEFSQFQRADDIFSHYCAKYSEINLKSKETEIKDYEITFHDIKDRVVLYSSDEDPSMSFDNS